MAKPPPSFFTNIFLRKNPSPNPTILNRSLSILGTNAGSEGSVSLNSDHVSDSKQHRFSEISKDVSRIIRTRPRWEQTLLSEFPSVNFADPNLYCEVLKRQKNVMVALRFYRWVSSQNGFLLDPVSSDVIFTGLVKAKAGSLAKSFLESTKYAPEPSSLEGYIECLCDNGLIEEALMVFDELKGVGHCPSLNAWNSALSGLVKVGKTNAVWKLYEDMMGCGVAGDVDTIGYLIYAFCLDRNYSKGYELLQQLLEGGHVPSNIVFNRLIYESCKNNEFFRMTALLFAMIAKNCSPDIYTYQEVIHGVRDCKNRDKLEVFRIFEYIKDRGYAPDRVMYSTVVHSLAKSNMLGKAQKVWSEMIKKRFVPDEYAYNALIHGYFKTGNLKEAERLHKEMLEKGFVDSTVTFNILIGGYCANGMFKRAYRLFEHMGRKGVVRDAITYNSLIQGFCEGGNASYGLKIFYDLLGHGLQASTTLYKALIERLCEEGRVEEAKCFLKDMVDQGLEPAICNHNSIIVGLTKQGKFSKGIEWLGTMIKSRLRPQGRTLERLIYSLSRADKWDDALLILTYMHKLGLQPSGTLYNVLVKKLFEEGRVEEAKRFLKDMVD
ncbi:pentatricopeptide repeat-containing protein At5g18950-like [Ipomoea triloba]|uniref:pentatricopeptide repeat-containing protein At5g18950-like n=1 Tax=Ipomoea triloba TaxID=35885 RepID=UPI00125D23C0|nr:pentatricopeptide repeat-containing protein At5g18950-like [Ipomoea triloba]XP_031119366.1 pentatricopeptide repeat-containing protein At5g18950-like [Ipomoea triloba]XP_031119367.1 pentatricopeptide repeat-containing protein At5g18950-like [Ipomoea triloba]